MEGVPQKKPTPRGGLVDDGRPVAMPQGNKRVPGPVEITQLAGTYKKGGRVAPGDRKLQAVFNSENATAMREAKAMSNEKYGPANKLKLKAGGSAC